MEKSYEGLQKLMAQEQLDERKTLNNKSNQKDDSTATITIKDAFKIATDLASSDMEQEKTLIALESNIRKKPSFVNLLEKKKEQPQIQGFSRNNKS